MFVYNLLQVHKVPTNLEVNQSSGLSLKLIKRMFLLAKLSIFAQVALAGDGFYVILVNVFVECLFRQSALSYM